VKKISDDIAGIVAPSQAMADQARQRHEILSRYQVDSLLTTGMTAPLRRTASGHASRVEAA